MAVMYAAKLVEVGDVREVFADPKHPYTQGLLRSVPNIKLDGGELYKMEGAPPNLLHPPVGCRFHPRCPFVMDICREQKFRPWNPSRGEQLASCWLYPSVMSKSGEKHAKFIREATAIRGAKLANSRSLVRVEHVRKYFPVQSGLLAIPAQPRQYPGCESRG